MGQTGSRRGRCGRRRGHVLLGYAAWRLVQGFFDSDRLGWGGLALRVSFVALGVVHAAPGLQAFRVYVAKMRREAGERAVALSRFGVAARAIVFVVSRIFASWNQLDRWLRQVEGLRRVA